MSSRNGFWNRRMRTAQEARFFGSVLLVFAFCVVLSHPSEAQDNAEERTGSAGAAVSERDRSATAALIAMTSDTDALCENFDAILSTPPNVHTGLDNDMLRVDTRFDDDMLREELSRRLYCGASWPQERLNVPKEWAQTLPSAELQAMCWLAECNKRMCMDRLEVRARQREAIMTVIRSSLQTTSDPEQIRGLLDVAFRTVFYVRDVVPQDGADEIIDLFKQYVGHKEPSVHEFARERLRHMGYVWRSRYDEILQFLIEKAPEIRKYLTAEVPHGIHVDILTGKDYRGGTAKEQDWRALDTMPPAALGAIVERTLSSYRSQDITGRKALGRLLADSTREDGEEAFRTLAELVRKGIRPTHCMYSFALHAAKEQPAGPSQVAQRRFSELLDAYRQAAESNWPEHYPADPLGALENALEAVKKGHEPGSEGAARLQVEQRLSEEIERYRKEWWGERAAP